MASATLCFTGLLIRQRPLQDTIPAVLLPVDAVALVELHPFLLEQFPLHDRPVAPADRDAAVPVDHPPPGHRGVVRQCLERLAHTTRRARRPQNRRDTAVTHHLSARALPHHVPHAVREVLRAPYFWWHGLPRPGSACLRARTQVAPHAAQLHAAAPA